MPTRSPSQPSTFVAFALLAGALICGVLATQVGMPLRFATIAIGISCLLAGAFIIATNVVPARRRHSDTKSDPDLKRR